MIGWLYVHAPNNNKLYEMILMIFMYDDIYERRIVNKHENVI